MPEIIYEDEAVLVISKPAGFATQSANVGQKDCVSFVKEHLSHEGSRGKGEPYVGIIAFSLSFLILTLYFSIVFSPYSYISPLPILRSHFPSRRTTSPFFKVSGTFIIR